MAPVRTLGSAKKAPVSARHTSARSYRRLDTDDPAPTALDAPCETRQESNDASSSFLSAMVARVSAIVHKITGRDALSGEEVADAPPVTLTDEERATIREKRLAKWQKTSTRKKKLPDPPRLQKKQAVAFDGQGHRLGEKADGRKQEENDVPPADAPQCDPSHTADARDTARLRKERLAAAEGRMTKDEKKRMKQKKTVNNGPLRGPLSENTMRWTMMM